MQPSTLSKPITQQDPSLAVDESKFSVCIVPDIVIFMSLSGDVAIVVVMNQSLL